MWETTQGVGFLQQLAAGGLEGLVSLLIATDLDGAAGLVSRTTENDTRGIASKKLPQPKVKKYTTFRLEPEKLTVIS